jgi:hypothetical protein
MNAGDDFQGSQYGILTAPGLGNAVLMPKSNDNPVGHRKSAVRGEFVAITMQGATVIRGPIRFNFHERVGVR